MRKFDSHSQPLYDFILHDTRYSGKWHLITDIETKIVPEQVREERVQVVDFKHFVLVPEPGVEYYEYKRYEPYKTWPYNATPKEYMEYYPVLGYTDVVEVTPAFLQATGYTLCNYGKLSEANYQSSYNKYKTARQKKFLGKKIKIQTGKHVTRILLNQTEVPEPLCLHCVKQMQLQYGVNVPDKREPEVEIL